MIAKCLNYISAYIILYPLLIIRIIFLNITSGSLWHDVIMPNLPILLSLLILFILSVLWLLNLLKWKNNTRITGTIKENITIEMAAFLATYIVPIITIDINWVGLTISLVIFLAFGVAFIASDKHFLNSTFLMFGYRLYRLDEKCVLYNKSMDSLKILLIENPDGINARELVPNTYIVLKS